MELGGPFAITKYLSELKKRIKDYYIKKPLAHKKSIV